MAILPFFPQKRWIDFKSEFCKGTIKISLSVLSKSKSKDKEKIIEIEVSLEETDACGKR